MKISDLFKKLEEIKNIHPSIFENSQIEFFNENDSEVFDLDDIKIERLFNKITFYLNKV